MSTHGAWTQSEAILLCKNIEEFAPDYGYHVALTGGCLYKDGERKDLDILFYRIRQVETPNRKGLISGLSSLVRAQEASQSYGWMTKVYIPGGRVIDVFFPEDGVGDYIPTADLGPSESNEEAA